MIGQFVGRIWCYVVFFSYVLYFFSFSLNTFVF